MMTELENILKILLGKVSELESKVEVLEDFKQVAILLTFLQWKQLKYYKNYYLNHDPKNCNYENRSIQIRVLNIQNTFFKYDIYNYNK